MRFRVRWGVKGDVLEAQAGGEEAHTFRGVGEKRRVAEEKLQSGVSERTHGINVNQVFQWRKLYRKGLLDLAFGRGRMQMLPVAVSEEAGAGSILILGAKRSRPGERLFFDRQHRTESGCVWSQR